MRREKCSSRKFLLASSRRNTRIQRLKRIKATYYRTISTHVQSTGRNNGWGTKSWLEGSLLLLTTLIKHRTLLHPHLSHREVTSFRRTSGLKCTQKAGKSRSSSYNVSPLSALIAQSQKCTPRSSEVVANEINTSKRANFLNQNNLIWIGC